MNIPSHEDVNEFVSFLVRVNLLLSLQGNLHSRDEEFAPWGKN